MRFTLKECLKKLARGKLSNLSLVENGNIREDSVDKVIDAINEALLRLYTTLHLKESSLLLELRESRTTYPLTSEHCMSHLFDKEPDLTDSYNYYIADTPHYPFNDDIIAVTGVTDEYGRSYPINKMGDPRSVFTSQDNILEVNFTIPGVVLNIIYQAKHPVLTKDNLEDKVEIPEILLGALFSYTAYLIHSDINTQEAVANSQKYLVEYQTIVSDAELNSMINQDTMNHDYKFITRGWV